MIMASVQVCRYGLFCNSILNVVSVDDFESARQQLQVQLSKNRSKAYSEEAYMQCLDEDIVQCTNALESKQVWNRKGKKVAMNM